MIKPVRITLIIISSVLVVSIVGYFVANAVATSKLENFLKSELPENLSVEYKSLEVSILNREVLMVQPKVVNHNILTSKTNVQVELDTLKISGFGLWRYLFKDHIHVDKIQLRSPKVLYNHNNQIAKNRDEKAPLDPLKQEIKIDQFNIQNAEISIREMPTDSLMFHTERLTANVMDIRLDSVSIKQRIPFNYDAYNLTFKDVFYSMGEFENLTLASVNITQDKAELDQLKLFTKYSKAKFDQMLSIERDHFDVSMASLIIENQKFGYEMDSVFYFKSPKIRLHSPTMHIYRNKLIADDLTSKNLYGSILRALNFNLTLRTIFLENATIVYSEKVNPDMGAGDLSFTKLNAEINNISNTYSESEKTTLDIDAIFMARTPLKVQWEFDVNNRHDAFLFKVDLGKLPSPDLNPFSQPNLKVKLEGELLQTYATVSGDSNTSRVDMRAKYEDFKVEILDGDGKKKNKVLSAIANLFIAKDSDKASDGFREGNKEGIKRDHTKSIFNFLWISIKAGLVSVLTGDGKKKQV